MAVRRKASNGHNFVAACRMIPSTPHTRTLQYWRRRFMTERSTLQNCGGDLSPSKARGYPAGSMACPGNPPQATDTLRYSIKVMPGRPATPRRTGSAQPSDSRRPCVPPLMFALCSSSGANGKRPAVSSCGSFSHSHSSSSTPGRHSGSGNPGPGGIEVLIEGWD